MNTCVYVIHPEGSFLLGNKASKQATAEAGFSL